MGSAPTRFDAFPEPSGADDDDVQWALQTARVQWERGSVSDAVTWLRRAADAATAASNPQRARELEAAAQRIAGADAASSEAAAVGVSIDFGDDHEEELPAVVRPSGATGPSDASAAIGESLRAALAGADRASAGGAQPNLPPAISPLLRRETTGLELDLQDTPRADVNGTPGAKGWELPLHDALSRGSVPPPPLPTARAELESAAAAAQAESPGSPAWRGFPAPRSSVAPALGPTASKEPGAGARKKPPPLPRSRPAARVPSERPLPPRSAPPPSMPPLPPSVPPRAASVAPRPASRPPGAPSPAPRPAAAPSRAAQPSAGPASKPPPPSVPPPPATASDLPGTAPEPLAAPGDASSKASPVPAPDLGATPAAPAVTEAAPSAHEAGPREAGPHEAGPHEAGAHEAGAATESAARAGAAEPGDSTVLEGIDLAAVRGLQDLPEDHLAALVQEARVEELAAEEELGGFAAALVLTGSAAVMPAVAEAVAATAGPGEVVFAEGTLDDGVSVRVVARATPTRVALWSKGALDAHTAECPWVAEDLRSIGDRFQALTGATLGPLGDRLDDDLRAVVFGKTEVRAMSPGQELVRSGEKLLGLHVVGVGRLEVLAEGASQPAEELMPGDFLFATAVMSAARAPATVRAGAGGAIVLFIPRSSAHELVMSIPPLLELLAG